MKGAWRRPRSSIAAQLCSKTERDSMRIILLLYPPPQMSYGLISKRIAMLAEIIFGWAKLPSTINRGVLL